MSKNRFESAVSAMAEDDIATNTSIEPDVLPGVLYVVATPIGNLGDLSARAIATLQAVDYIAAEDTRHTAGLLRHFGIATSLVSYHQHNEQQRSAKIVRDLKSGKSVALVSDAGTPLLSDPGFPLLRALQAEGLRAIPIPGASSITAALSVAGLATDRFAFEGFLPAKIVARQTRLQALEQSPYTLVFLESSHRIHETLAAMVTVFGTQRSACIARELSKHFEEVHTASIQQLIDWLDASPTRSKGEFVIIVAAAPNEPVTADTVTQADQRTLRLLLNELPLKRAVALAAEIGTAPKNALYALALNWKNHVN